jgi:hypothetical protein
MTVNNMKPTYSLQDICTSYSWLGHQPHYTELNAYHKDFRQGKENYSSNYKYKAFTKIAYVKNEKEVKIFVEKYHDDHMCCYSLNPRQQMHRNGKGYPRAAVESEITISQNLFIDLDCIEKTHLDEKIASLELLLPQFDEYFLSNGAKHPPVTAYTGQGYHLLFAFPSVTIKKHPDIRNRIKHYQDQFRQEFEKTFSDTGIKVDSIHDQKRMVKIYGTSKRGVDRLSKFFGGQRVDDKSLRKYLLDIKLPDIKDMTIESKVNQELPVQFRGLLEKDVRLKGLWEGVGKSDCYDTSSAGYDFSLVRYCLQLGIDRISDLSTILSLRPDGVSSASGGGKKYIQNTIANAIKR